MSLPILGHSRVFRRFCGEEDRLMVLHQLRVCLGQRHLHCRGTYGRSFYVGSARAAIAELRGRVEC